MSMTDQNQSRANTLFHEARALFADDQFQPALTKLAACLQSQYDHAPGWLLRGRTLAAMKNFNEAAISLRRSAIAGALDPAWQQNVAREFMRIGRFPMAGAILRVAMTFGEDVGALNLMSEIQASQGQFPRAKASVERALELEPGNTLSQTLLANIIGNKVKRPKFTREDVEASRTWAVHFEGPPQAAG